MQRDLYAASLDESEVMRFLSIPERRIEMHVTGYSATRKKSAVLTWVSPRWEVSSIYRAYLSE